MDDLPTLTARLGELAGPAGEPPIADLVARGRARRRRVWRGGLLASVVILTAVTVSVSVLITRRAHPAHAAATASPVTAPTAADLAGGRWTSFPPAPIAPRSNPAAVWTGRQMIVWGGQTFRPAAILADGAAYEPATRTWTALPPAPIAGRVDPVAVWTGREFVLWGGYGANGQDLTDGVRYDPVTRTWRRLPSAPMAGAGSHVGVVADGRVVVVGAVNASYDPASDAWTTLPPNPRYRSGGQTALAVGRDVYVWTAWVQRFSADRGDEGVDLAVFDTQAGTWRSIPATPGAPTGVQDAFWTGQEIIVAPADVQIFRCDVCQGPGPVYSPGARYDPASGTWTRLGVVSSGEVDHYVSAGRTVVAFDNGNVFTYAHAGAPTAVLDARLGQWLAVPDPPSYLEFPAAVWTGHELLIWGEGSRIVGGRIEHLGQVAYQLTPR